MIYGYKARISPESLQVRTKAMGATFFVGRVESRGWLSGDNVDLANTQ
jgi:hypothetical protein